MNYCPLMSYAKQYAQEIPCLGEECALAADGAGECLIKQALALYVSGERTRRAEEEERTRQEIEAAMTYWKMKKDGTRTPLQFLKDGDTTPVQLRHGGVYDDLSPLRNDDSSAGSPLTYKPSTTADVQLRPPAIDGSYINF